MACLTTGLTAVAWLIILAGAAWIGLRFFEWKNLYYPEADIKTTPADFGLDYDDIDFISEDGHALHGWWIPNRNARGTVLHCHGNAGNIGDRAWLAADLHRLGVNVFLFDYRGYGRSRGLATERGTYDDARAAFEVVRARHLDAERPPVIVYGQSLGGAVAIQLALEKPVAGLIVESTFTSVVEMGERLYPTLPVRRLASFRYESISKVAALKMPKLFAHSPGDNMIPFEMGQALYAAAAEPKRFVELAGDHNEAGWTVSPEYWGAVTALVDNVLVPACRNSS